METFTPDYPHRPKNSPEMDFFIFLLHHYAFHKGTTADKILKELDERGITDWVFRNYEFYHVEAIENAYRDLDSMLTTGKPAW